MKILNHVNFINSIGADRWIGSGYKDALEDLGHEVFWLTNLDNLEKRLAEIQPHILFIGMEKLRWSNMAALEKAKKAGTKIVVAVNSLFEEDKEATAIMTNTDIADLYRGETEQEWMGKFSEITGKKYITTPNAAHHRFHFPASPVEKYKCDIVFLGANLPLKKSLFSQLLFPLRRKYKVRLYGPSWTVKDNFLRAMAYGLRKLKLSRLNEWVSKYRLTVPPAEENQLYSSAKICINIHEERKGKTVNHVILNERTFKIPACGGFELCDFVPPEEVLRKYFTKEEMVRAVNSEDWFQKIDYYLHNDEERKAIQQKGTARALKDHTYLNRAKQILTLLGF
jgi:spore maturation protein CgeB